MRTKRIAAVLLAAGTSSRFGEEDKLMTDLRGKPMAAHVLETVASMAFAELIAKDGKLWADVIKKAGIQPQ